MKKTINVLVVEDHALYREAVCHIISSSDLNIRLDEAENGEVAFEKVLKTKFDLVILDINLPKMNGIDFLNSLWNHSIKTKVIVLSMFDYHPQIFNNKELNISGYLRKSTSKEEILRAIITVLEGGIYFQESESFQYNSRKCEPVQNLSSQEINILKHLCGDLTRKQLADKLCISENTLNNHICNIMKKINVQSQMGLIRFALKSGLFQTN